MLELDELWSFVARRTNQVWIWIALYRKTRQVVAYAVGDRSEERKVVTNAKRIPSRVRILNRNLIHTGEKGNVHFGKKR